MSNEKKKPYQATYTMNDFRAGVALDDEGRVRVNLDQRDGSNPEAWTTWSPVAGLELLKQIPSLRRVYVGIHTAQQVYEAVMKAGTRR